VEAEAKAVSRRPRLRKVESKDLTRVSADPGEGDGVGVGELARAGADEVVAAVGEAVLVDLPEPLGFINIADGDPSLMSADILLKDWVDD